MLSFSQCPNTAGCYPNCSVILRHVAEHLRQNAMLCGDTQASSENSVAGNAAVRAIHNQIIFRSWLNSRPTPGYFYSLGARLLRVSSDVPTWYYGHPCAV